MKPIISSSGSDQTIILQTEEPESQDSEAKKEEDSSEMAVKVDESKEENKPDEKAKKPEETKEGKS